jgi:type II secretory pathway component PulC
MAATLPIHNTNLRLSTPLWTAIGLGLAGSAWMVFSVFTALTEPVDHQNQIGLQKQLPRIATTIDVGTVGSLNLFGTVAVDVPIDITTLPITTLNLTLSGIIAGVHPETSRALIAEAGKPSKAYFTGDQLADGTNLYSIDTDFVVVQRGDRLEKLSLYRADPVITTPARHRASSAAETVSVAPPPEPLAAPPPQESMSLDERIAAIRKKNST